MNTDIFIKGGGGWKMRGHVLKCIQRGGGGGVGHQGVKKNSLHVVKCCLMRRRGGISVEPLPPQWRWRAYTVELLRPRSHWRHPGTYCTALYHQPPFLINVQIVPSGELMLRNRPSFLTHKMPQNLLSRRLAKCHLNRPNFFETPTHADGHFPDSALSSFVWKYSFSYWINNIHVYSF